MCRHSVTKSTNQKSPFFWQWQNLSRWTIGWSRCKRLHETGTDMLQNGLHTHYKPHFGYPVFNDMEINFTEMGKASLQNRSTKEQLIPVEISHREPHTVTGFKIVQLFTCMTATRGNALSESASRLYAKCIGAKLLRKLQQLLSWCGVVPDCNLELWLDGRIFNFECAPLNASKLLNIVHVHAWIT